MLDLHIHTHHSDGALNVVDILKLAEQSKLQYISITDHNTVDGYEYLKNINIKDYFSGKIIPGIEIACNFNDCSIEVLGYGFDLDKLKNSDFMKKYFPLSMRKHYTKKLEEYKEIFRGLGIKFSENLELGNKVYANRALIEDILKYPENELLFKKLDITDINKAQDEFLEKHTFNKDSSFYDNYFFEGIPSVKEAVDIIKSNGGKVFLAHPFRYKIEGKKLIDDLAELNILDGLECVNKVHSDEQIEYLINYCNNHRLMKSAGSDFHRSIEHKLGYGNCGTYAIKQELVDDLISVISRECFKFLINVD